WKPAPPHTTIFTTSEIGRTRARSGRLHEHGCGRGVIVLLDPPAGRSAWVGPEAGLLGGADPGDDAVRPLKPQVVEQVGPIAQPEQLDVTHHAVRHHRGTPNVGCGRRAGDRFVRRVERGGGDPEAAWTIAVGRNDVWGVAGQVVQPIVCDATDVTSDG